VWANSEPSPLRRAETQDVVQMVKARFADSTIIKLIKANDTDFDLSIAAVMQLKNSGASQAVIEAMIATAEKKQTPKPERAEANPLPLTTPTPPKAGDLPDEIGVYIRENGKLVAIEPEIVSWRTGGVVKVAVTLGLDKGHLNGTVRGPHSRLDLTKGSTNSSRLMGIDSELEFYIHSREGDSASEYQLLKFWGKGDRREFRTVTGGVLHASDGAQDNVLDFKFNKVASRTYKIVLKGLVAGEYGFLAPGTTAGLNAASHGNVYTFRIAE